jgi:ABC-2 type transport system permease protein
MLLIPIVMTGMVGMVFGPSDDGGQFPAIRVLLVDNDKAFASQLLVGAFDSEQVKDLFQITMVDEKEGRRLIGKGKASALVIIPKDFTKHLVKAEKVEIEVIKNPSEQFLPEIVEEFMRTLAVGVSGAVQVFETEIKAVDALVNLDIEKVTIAQMTPFMETGRTKIIALKKYLDPLILKLKHEVKREKKKKAEPVVDVFGMILPGMAVMFILFIVEMVMRDILTEREDGKFQRIMFSPIRSMEFVLARIVSGWVIGVLVCFIMVVLGIMIFGIAWGNYLYLFVLAAVTSFWIASFFALLNSFFKNKNQAGTLVAPIILVFSAFGGSMMPVSQLPGSVRWVSDLTLNQWFIKGAQLVNKGQFPALPVTIILGTGLVLFLAGTFFLKRRITV